MSLPRSFVLERIGGHRRSVEGAGWTCAFLGPRDAGVDILGEGPLPLVRIRGGTMEVRDYHAHLLGSGERLRVLGEPPTLTVLSDRRAQTEIEVRDEAERRRWTWLRDGGIAGVLWTGGPDPWTLEVPAWEEPLRCLAALLAAERLLREVEDQRSR